MRNIFHPNRGKVFIRTKWTFSFLFCRGKMHFVKLCKVFLRKGRSISDIEEGIEANASWEVTKTIKMGGGCGRRGIIEDMQ
jgi:hypothetical protein